ncbi:MAG: hypothetical protein HWE30_11880 [Methylocystaceae bacterium]|nr:hypothetical protein [Methylocystaceae bacterium]
MQIQDHAQNVDLNETLALRILRSCPKALQTTGLGKPHREAVCRLKKVLAHCARKPVALSMQNYPHMSLDEKCLINALAAAQNGQREVVFDLLTWLLPRWAVDMVEEEFFLIAQVFDAIKINLTFQSVKAPVRRENAGLYAVIGSNLCLSSTG